MGETAASKDARPRRRTPKRATARHLENVALWYLQRFAASADSLRKVLMRRVEKSARTHETDRAEGARLVEAIIMRFQESGLLDDRVYAQGRASSLHRRGVSTRGIRARLAAKGVGADDIDAALDVLRDTMRQPDLAAAIAYARRRRIGPWRRADERAEKRERDLAAMARQGFDYDTARRVIEAENSADLEDEMRS